MHKGYQILVLTALASIVGFADLTAQGRGRGKSEAVRERLGAYFVDATIPEPEDGAKTKEILGSVYVVDSAKDAGELAILYLYDGDKDEDKHKKFEQTMFNHDATCVALKYFVCARIDLCNDAYAMEKFGKKAPLFVAFNKQGKYVGEVSMKGYKATTSPLMKILEKAAKGYSKVPLKKFVKEYRSFLNDLQLIDGKQRALTAQRERANKKSGNAADKKLAAIEKDEEALKAEEEQLFERETKLLDKCKALPRDAQAKRVGERPRRR